MPRREKTERERERAISLTADSEQPAPDKTERTLSGALSTMHASDKGEEAPESLKEIGSPSKDKGVPSEQEHTNSLKVITMHSQTEFIIVVSPKADKKDGTQLPLDERAQDKNEDEDGVVIPPPLFKECPQGNDRGLRSPKTQAILEAAKERTSQQRLAPEISTIPFDGWAKGKQ